MFSSSGIHLYLLPFPWNRMLPVTFSLSGMVISLILTDNTSFNLAPVQYINPIRTVSLNPVFVCMSGALIIASVAVAERAFCFVRVLFLQCIVFASRKYLTYVISSSAIKDKKAIRLLRLRFIVWFAFPRSFIQLSHSSIVDLSKALSRENVANVICC